MALHNQLRVRTRSSSPRRGQPVDPLFIVITGIAVLFALATSAQTLSGWQTPASHATNATSASTLRRVLVVQDTSSSGTQTGIPRLGATDLERMFDALSTKGNFELIFGILNARSGLQFVRASKVDARPTEPIPPPAGINPFEKRRAQERYEKDLAAFRAALEVWDRIAAAAKRDFLSHIKRLLSTGVADGTDVGGALTAASVLFGEDAASGRVSMRYLVMCTDGIDTAGRQFAELPTGISTYVINKVGSVGILSSLHPNVLFDFEPMLDLAKGWR